ncbi:hypothetical protein L6452_14750 [Arctium lappa]|uniref:Uncharacterized protein n=1 Tax=Arctium lappa TaxID=4217 RepID=A0ACB9CM58_ARCLA|nr:hypothetical protein L6452_14750 [Arctium lappa]
MRPICSVCVIIIQVFPLQLFVEPPVLASSKSEKPRKPQVRSDQQDVTFPRTRNISTCLLLMVLKATPWKISPVGIKKESRHMDPISNHEAIDSSSSSPSPSSPMFLDFESHHCLVDEEDSQDLQEFPTCNMSYSEYTPCQD